MSKRFKEFPTRKKSQDLCSNFMYYLLLVHHVLLVTVITHSAS